MKYIEYDRYADMERDAASLLMEHMTYACLEPHAVMLTGGDTPLGLYERVRRAPVLVDRSLYLLISDERYVPLSSQESNFGRMSGMVDVLFPDNSHVMRVQTELGLLEAAEKYDQEISGFLDDGGRITLAILGLGADGHVASIFNKDDMRRGAGKCAIAVNREGGDRVTVTVDLLKKAEKQVFFVRGAGKKEIVRRMQESSDDVIAAMAVGDDSSELWFCGES